MARISASGSTVTFQMETLLSKTCVLLEEDSILGDAVSCQLKELVQTSKQSDLEHAEEKQINGSRELEEWLEKVNAAISMADDVLDECRYRVRVASKEPKRDKRRAYTSSLWRKGLRSRLKSMNSKLTSILKDGDQLSWSAELGAPAGRSAAAQAGMDCGKLESEIFKDGVQTVVDRLLDPDNCSDLSVSVVALVGWNETGKTSLAQLVYQDLDVMSYFEERMWVQVPADLNKDTIAQRMLTNLSRVGDAVELEKRLKGKRFLLVLAGALDIIPSRFSQLKRFLVGLGGLRGSKVLITCEKYPHHSINSSFKFVYRMRLDSSQYCWTLFDKIAFAEGGPVRTDEMEETGRAIVDLCLHNPLYIKLLGSLLYRLKDEIQWSSVVEKLRLGPKGIPQLCFDYMTSLPLKRCFLYCYFLPRGCLMRREELIELWMAQGYLDHPNGLGHRMGRLGREYYDVLLRSSFFQVSEDDDFDARSCKIPDALRHLNLFTESSEDCFKTIQNDKDKENAKEFRGAYVHLTLINFHVKLSKSFRDRFSKLRSLRLENTKDLARILDSARGLRVLIIVDEELKELPDSIGNLISLRYLDISGTSIVKLPDSISNLCNLQTLRLHDLKKLPNNCENLFKSMMHLYIHKLEDLYDMHGLLSNCGSLVYLSSAKATLKVSVDKEGKLDCSELHKLSDRGSNISIHCLENASKDASGINKWLSRIPAEPQSLKLTWSARRGNKIDEDVLDKLDPNRMLKELTLENFKGTRFASWMMQLSNLVKLELENCSWCEKLLPFGELPCLRFLRIAGMDNVKSITADFYGSGNTCVFPKLKEFSLCGMSELEDWNGSTDASATVAFPFLESFEVDQCPKLRGIPDIVLAGKPKCLRKFKVSHCDQVTHLPKGRGELASLEDLELFGLPKLEEGFSSIGNATNLKRLIIGCVSADRDKEDGLLRQLDRLTCLTNLTIWGYNQEKIPDCFRSLKSLEFLKFESCQHLKELPQMITNLQKLQICYCPALEDSCIRGSRPQWPKVSHIKTILVNNEIVREPPPPKRLTSK